MLRTDPLPTIHPGLLSRPVTSKAIQLRKWLRRLTTTAVLSSTVAATGVGYGALKIHDQIVSNVITQVREQTLEEVKDAALQETKKNFLADSKQVNTTCYNWWFNTKRN